MPPQEPARHGHLLCKDPHQIKEALVQHHAPISTSQETATAHITRDHGRQAYTFPLMRFKGRSVVVSNRPEYYVLYSKACLVCGEQKAGLRKSDER
jgi:hypothetical protein